MKQVLLKMPWLFASLLADARRVGWLGPDDGMKNYQEGFARGEASMAMATGALEPWEAQYVVNVASARYRGMAA